MNIVILSRNPKLYSTDRLVEEGEKRGHKIEVIDPLKCDLIIEKEKPDVVFLDIQMPKLDGVEFIKTLSNPPKVIFTTAYRDFLWVCCCKTI